MVIHILYVVEMLLLALAIRRYSSFKGWITVLLYGLTVAHWYLNIHIPIPKYGLRPELVIVQILMVILFVVQFARR